MSAKRSATSGRSSGVPKAASLWGSLTRTGESQGSAATAGEDGAGAKVEANSSTPGTTASTRRDTGADKPTASTASTDSSAGFGGSAGNATGQHAAREAAAPSRDTPKDSSSGGAAADGPRKGARTTGGDTTSIPAAGRGVTVPSGGGTPSRAAPARPTGRTRRAHLRVTHVDPWSVMKTAFLLSIAFGIVCVVAVGIIWTVLGAAGVWDSINTMVQDTVGSDSSTPFDITNYVGTSRILGFTMIAAVIDVILITAIATLGAFVYNLAATLLGGVEVTLTEDR